MAAPTELLEQLTQLRIAHEEAKRARKLSGETDREHRAHHAHAMDRGADCTRCPLYGCGEGPVAGEVRAGSRLAIVGEAPGKQEVEDGRVMVGPTGAILWSAIERGGLRRDDTTVVNAIECRPPGGNLQDYVKRLKYEYKIACDRAEAAGEALPAEPVLPTTACHGRLLHDLDVAASTTLLAVGGEALRALAQRHDVPTGKYAKNLQPGDPRAASIKKQHGAPILTKDGHTICSALHPVFSMRGAPQYRERIEADIERAAKIAARSGKIDWVEPPFYVRPTEDQVHYFLSLFEAFPHLPVTIDVETNGRSIHKAKIRCVGLGMTLPLPQSNGSTAWTEVVVSIPLRLRNGTAYFRPEADTRVRNHIRKALDVLPWAGQNLLFDTAIMLRADEGLISPHLAFKQWFDMMLAHHNSRNGELPHDLGFIASELFEAPRWKEDADVKSDDEGGDDDLKLWVYNCKDVLGEMRGIKPMWEKVVNSACHEAFATDTELAPIARDMGRLGIPMNEVLRKQFFRDTTQVYQSRLKAVRDVVGRDDFNPNSPRQVARWLYVKQGVTPQFDANGNDWAKRHDDDEDGALQLEEADELERASTSEEALLAIQDGGCSEIVEKFIDNLLMFRGMAKVRGTYLGYKEDDGKKDNGARLVPGLEDFGKLVDRHRERDFLIDRHMYLPEVSRWETIATYHTSWAIHIVPTGRWASRPNFQNIPERIVFDPKLYKESGGKQGIINLRQMYEAAPGYCLIGADYAAIELRLYAIVAQDFMLLDAISKGVDPHALNYATMQAHKPEDIEKWYHHIIALPDKQKKHLRNIAKRFFFLCVFGGQKEKLFKTMKADRNPDGTRSFPDLKQEDTWLWFDNLHAAHPMMREWQARVVRSAAENGYVAAQIDFRKRFFLAGPDPTAMPNHPIQGTAAAIMNRAMKRIGKECGYQKWGVLSGPFAQVHDYAGLHVPRSRRADGERLLDEAMPTKVGDFPIAIERKTADWIDKDGKPARPSWDRT